LFAWTVHCHKVTVLDFASAQGRAAVQTLKAMLNRLLLGSSANSKLRHGRREVEDPSVMWGVLMGQALYGLDLKAFDEDEKQRRIEDRYGSRWRASGRGGGREIIYRLRCRVRRRRKRPITAVTSTSGVAGFGTCTASSSSLLYPLWST
jgi:hypothetical protein